MGTLTLDQRAANQLDRAADRITKYGWRQGAAGSYKTGFCALGAIYPSSTSCTKDVQHRCWEALTKTTISVAPPAWSESAAIADWNDAPKRTAKQVVKALHKAAKALRKGEV